jgi:alpha-ketoglutarate-dependent taurine dioxygenase
MQVRDLTPEFGALITDFDVQTELSGAAADLLRTLFDERGALIFCGLDIGHEEQARICRTLLDDDNAPISPPDFEVSNKKPDASGASGRLQFHADAMWHPEPLRVLSLYGQEVGEGAAATLVASGIYGYESLPDHLRKTIANLRVVQVTGPVPGRAGDDISQPIRTREASVEKDIVQICPRSGKKILYVCPQTTRNVIGMTPEESERLLQELFSYLYRPENIYEHIWKNGDLLVLNNIAMQHARSYVDPYGPVRVLHKVVAPISKISSEIPRFVARAM